MVKSINFVVLGKQDLASEFGKKGTESDLTLYDRKESDVIKTWVIPNGFPEKIQPLFQAINLAEYVIFHVDKLDKFTGEQIIALDSLKKEKGILSHTFDVDESKLNMMIKGTVVENYTRVEQDKIKEEMNALEPITNDNPAELLIDHCFDVKGVGTVILGKVSNGTIKQYDNLKLYPHNIDVLIKSIQMHDDPVSESICPARVGLAVKGAKPDEVGRGDVISVEDAVEIKTEIELDFEKSPFYKSEITENQGCLVNIGLQTKAAKFSSITPLKLVFEKPIVCKKNDIAVILKPESTTIRILGSGKIL
ncbi:MAG: elongation factor Tu [Nitrosopumilus sp.]|nr:elongation factor Tu [Nitrosopumilus sp.]MDC0209166.1 EF-Tu/IF-2/RF-3 family GTPase [Nitrosopumilus sp.]MDC0209739.1 EF-Tu/IF-2/RF-3 family GTPase [Nitrosopumilus sp.]RCL30740.1 MAG: elongation factor Tu [Nitrosopumilus sp.]|tara:strand:- start:124 stop:1044 length:921 start_codon:yes stop_codon:yes gene_type:complete